MVSALLARRDRLARQGFEEGDYFLAVPEVAPARPGHGRPRPVENDRGWAPSVEGADWSIMKHREADPVLLGMAACDHAAIATGPAQDTENDDLAAHRVVEVLQWPELGPAGRSPLGVVVRQDGLADELADGDRFSIRTPKSLIEIDRPAAPRREPCVDYLLMQD